MKFPHNVTVYHHFWPWLYTFYFITMEPFLCKYQKILPYFKKLEYSLKKSNIFLQSSCCLNKYKSFGPFFGIKRQLFVSQLLCRRRLFFSKLWLSWKLSSNGNSKLHNYKSAIKSIQGVPTVFRFVKEKNWMLTFSFLHETLYIAQCRNIMIFLSLRFYVKPFLRILEGQSLPF